MDYAQARYYSNAMGRFTRPDPLPMSPERQKFPQSINLYAYVANNPLIHIDPTGMDKIRLGQHTDQQIDDIVTLIELQKNIPGQSKARITELNNQINNLNTEKNGNRAVSAALAMMGSVGELGKLQLSDFAVLTTPTKDVADIYRGMGYTRANARKAAIRDNPADTESFVLRAGNFKDKTIYFPVNPNGNTFSDYIKHSDANDVNKANDDAISLALNIVHERYHRDSYSLNEKRAALAEYKVFQAFAPGQWNNQQFRINLEKDIKARCGTRLCP